MNDFITIDTVVVIFRQLNFKKLNFYEKSKEIINANRLKIINKTYFDYLRGGTKMTQSGTRICFYQKRMKT
jgi:hypothetical protein